MLPFPSPPNIYSFFHHFILLINYEYIHAKTVGPFRHTHIFLVRILAGKLFSDFISLPFYHSTIDWIIFSLFDCCVAVTFDVWWAHPHIHIFIGRSYMISEKKMKADEEKKNNNVIWWISRLAILKWMNEISTNFRWIAFRVKNGIRWAGGIWFWALHQRTSISSKFIYLFRFSGMSKLTINEHHVHTLSILHAQFMDNQMDCSLAA